MATGLKYCIYLYSNKQRSVQALLFRITIFIYKPKLKNINKGSSFFFLNLNESLTNDLIKDTEPFSPLLPRLIPSFPAIYPAHVWHMAATDLHASIMLDAIVLEGGRERERCLQYLPVASGHEAVSA